MNKSLIIKRLELENDVLRALCHAGWEIARGNPVPESARIDEFRADLHTALDKLHSLEEKK